MNDAADLHAFALTLRGTAPYRELYKKLLLAAFTTNGDILNAKRLRELAGGGSQETAQAAIEQFKKDIAKRVGTKIALGGDIPPELATLAGELIQQMWARSSNAATSLFESDRKKLSEEIATALQNKEMATAQARKLAEELAKTKEALHLSNTENQALKTQLQSTQRLLDSERQARDEIASEKAQISEQLKSERHIHEQAIKQLKVAHDSTTSIQNRLLQAQTRRTEDLQASEREARKQTSEALIEKAVAAQKLEAAQVKLAQTESELRTALEAATQLRREAKTMGTYPEVLGKQLLKWTQCRFGSTTSRQNIRAAENLFDSMDKEAVRIAHLIESIICSTKADKPQKKARSK